jgi:hypothetical protein
MRVAKSRKRRRAKRTKESAPICVENDGQHDHRPDDDRLEIVAGAEQLQSGAEDLKDASPLERADD